MILQQGYTLVELLVALVVGTLTIAAAMASYTIVSGQYNRIDTLLRLEEQGHFAMASMQQEIIRANYMDPNTNIVAAINVYIGMVDDATPAVNNSDSIWIVYDESPAVRLCVQFDVVVDQASGLAQLQRTQVPWNENAVNGCDFANVNAGVEPLSSHVESFQVEIITDENGNNLIAALFLLLESDVYQFSTPVNFVPLDYEAGSNQWVLVTPQSTNMRRDFSATVFLRNVVQ